MIDSPGLDTALAFLLHRRDLVPLEILKELLGASRFRRPDGPTPARLLLVPQVGNQIFLTGRPTGSGEPGTTSVGGALQQQRGSRADPRYTPPGYDPRTETVPSLATLTRVALNALDDDPEGFFLHVEGGSIDWAMHQNQMGRTIEDHRYTTISVFDPQSIQPVAAVIYDSPDRPLHSPVFLGTRPRPPVLPEKVDPRRARDVRATGVLFCQNVRFTKNNTAGWENVRAIRVIAAKGLTTRSSHSYIVHAGNETTELGTVRLAPDGSFSIEVPADRLLHFQVLDSDRRVVGNQLTWIYPRGGETKSCVGCHENPHTTTRGKAPLALRTDPAKFLPHGDEFNYRAKFWNKGVLPDEGEERTRTVRAVNLLGRY